MKIQFKNNVVAEPIIGQQLICPGGLGVLMDIDEYAPNKVQLDIRLPITRIVKKYDSTVVEYLNIPGRLHSGIVEQPLNEQ